MRGLEIFHRHLVVLDTTIEVTRFMRLVDRIGCDPLVTNTVLDELISEMHQEHNADDNIRKYVDEVASGMHLADDCLCSPLTGNYVTYDIKPTLAPAILELGIGLLEQINDLGLYNKEGVLPYGVYSSPTEDCYEKVNRDMILVSQTHEDLIN